MREANLKQFADRPEDSVSLSNWLLSFGKSREFASLVSRFAQREGWITPPEETATLYAIVQRLRPRWILEIGTFFAHTTRIMAEAIVDAGLNGKLITLDPFGQERAPEILRSWPEPLSAVTDFRSWDSMQYFLELETQCIPKGADSPLGVVFVDGHHNFEYVLFDIIRSADHLAPGGAIIVDNLEQQGPRAAAIQFLRWNPAWSLFYEGHLFSADDIDAAPIAVNPDGRTLWGVLLAPVGIQVGWLPTKIMQRNVSYAPIRALIFNVRHISHSGALRVNMQYYAVPFDYHITGRGMCFRRGEGIAFSGREPTMKIEFPSPLELEMARSDVNVHYEIEVSYQSDAAQIAYVVLDAREPVVLQS